MAQAISYSGAAVPRAKAVYCDDCDNISEAVEATATRGRCSVCGSESIVSVASLIGEPSDAHVVGKKPTQSAKPRSMVFAFRPAA